MPVTENKSSLAQKAVSYLAILFFCYASVYAAVRVFLVGGNAMNGMYDGLITVFPDLLFAAILTFTVKLYIEGNRFKLIFTDKLVLFYIVFNLVYGTIIATKLPIAARGFRITYFPVIFYFIGRVYSMAVGKKGDKAIGYIFYWLIFQGALAIAFHFIFSDFEASLIQASNHVELSYFIRRMGGFFLTPVWFGTTMTITAIYFYHRLLTTSNKWNYLFIAIAWTCIFLSVSRGPIMGFIIGFIVITLLFKKWRETALTLALIVIVSALLSYILTGSLNILTWLFSSTADTLGMQKGVTRVMLWKLSWHEFMQRPYGYGLGHSGAMAERFLKGTDVPASIHTTDGWYLKLLCETGVLGVLSFLVFAGYYIIYARKKVSAHLNSLFSFALALFVMICAQCVVSNIFDFYPIIGIVWFVMGYSINIAEQQSA